MPIETISSPKATHSTVVTLRTARDVVAVVMLSECSAQQWHRSPDQGSPDLCSSTLSLHLLSARYFIEASRVTLPPMSLAPAGAPESVALTSTRYVAPCCTGISRNAKCDPVAAWDINEQPNSAPATPPTSGYTVITAPESAPLSARKLSNWRCMVPADGAVTENHTPLSSADFVHEWTGSSDAPVALLVSWIATAGSVRNAKGEETPSFPCADSAAS